MENLKVKSLGPIKEANINFGDLTLFVGPQASGKSILLQLIKLIIDKKFIRKTTEQYGFVWGNKEKEILDTYFGEGMSSIWSKNTKINFNNTIFSPTDLLPKNTITNKAVETVFYIPAQRVMCFSDGRAKNFTEYENAPYVLRYFGESQRQFLDNSLSKTDLIFPQKQRLKDTFRASFNKSIFHDGEVVMDKTGGRKRLKLQIDDNVIPFMSWSAGQKEFLPLLLSFYWLCPTGINPKTAKEQKDSIKYVIIEEPEMGLHPKAIESVILQIFDLLARGYKIIISTHSPLLLEFAWAFQFLKKSKVGVNEFLELFNLEANPIVNDIFKKLLTKKLKTYYFDQSNNKTQIKDISTLDAGSEDTAIAEWGGLSSFASRASDIVAKSVNHG